MGRKLTKSQSLALKLAHEAPLVRTKGGFWTRRGEPSERVEGTCTVPERYVAGRTIRVLEERGLLRRVDTGTHTSYRHPRVITIRGLEAIGKLPDFVSDDVGRSLWVLRSLMCGPHKMSDGAASFAPADNVSYRASLYRHEVEHYRTEDWGT